MRSLAQKNTVRQAFCESIQAQRTQLSPWNARLFSIAWIPQNVEEEKTDNVLSRRGFFGDSKMKWVAFGTDEERLTGMWEDTFIAACTQKETFEMTLKEGVFYIKCNSTNVGRYQLSSGAIFNAEGQTLGTARRPKKSVHKSYSVEFFGLEIGEDWYDDGESLIDFVWKEESIALIHKRHKAEKAAVISKQMTPEKEMWVLILTLIQLCERAFKSR